MRRLLRDILPYIATPLHALLRELKQRRVNALLCQDYEYARFDIAVFLGRLLDIPAFDFSRWHLAFKPNRIVGAPAHDLSLRRGNHRSSWRAHRVKARYRLAEEGIARIPNPLDLDLWRPIERARARRELGLSMEQRIVICHGRIDVHRKGLDVLLATWADVHARCPP